MRSGVTMQAFRSASVHVDPSFRSTDSSLMELTVVNPGKLRSAVTPPSFSMEQAAFMVRCRSDGSFPLESRGRARCRTRTSEQCGKYQGGRRQGSYGLHRGSFDEMD